MRSEPYMAAVICAIAVCSPGLAGAPAAARAPARPVARQGTPPTRPAAVEAGLPELQAALLRQLADAEANIQAINEALARTKYHVGKEYDRIASNEKGNELMDRKGGGPVRWDHFYGRTAKEYNENGGSFDREPRQFQKIKDANRQ